jgi:hypothetical protein
MENDEGFFGKNQLFITEPERTSLKDTIRRALDTKMSSRIDMSEYTWDSYFGKIHNACKTFVSGVSDSKKDQ